MHGRAKGLHALGFVTAAVPDMDGIAGFAKAAGQGEAHEADAEHGNGLDGGLRG